MRKSVCREILENTLVSKEKYIKELELERLADGDKISSLKKSLAEKEAECSGLRVALAINGKHLSTCYLEKYQGESCTCGLNLALSGKP